LLFDDEEEEKERVEGVCELFVESVFAGLPEWRLHAARSEAALAAASGGLAAGGWTVVSGVEAAAI